MKALRTLCYASLRHHEKMQGTEKMKTFRDANMINTVDNSRAPDLKDTNITPGSLLDLDGDCRRDSKEMSLHALWHLQHGDTMANGQVKQHEPNCVLALPKLLPSTHIPAVPKIVPNTESCAPKQFEDDY